jgi:prepilin-type processing-associated H-X9-DG protein
MNTYELPWKEIISGGPKVQIFTSSGGEYVFASQLIQRKILKCSIKHVLKTIELHEEKRRLPRIIRLRREHCCQTRKSSSFRDVLIPLPYLDRLLDLIQIFRLNAKLSSVPKSPPCTPHHLRNNWNQDCTSPPLDYRIESAPFYMLCSSHHSPPLPPPLPAPLPVFQDTHEDYQSTNPDQIEETLVGYSTNIAMYDGHAEYQIDETLVSYSTNIAPSMDELVRTDHSPRINLQLESLFNSL